jgi:hypothetical protein
MRLLRTNDPTAGRAVVSVTPAARRTTWLAGDILTALGASRDVAGGLGTRVSDEWDLKPIWLAAYPIQHLIVVQAQRLQPGPLTDLLTLADQIEATVTLPPKGRSTLDSSS